MSPVNKQAIAAAFGRAAQSYSQHDELQRQSAQGLLAALGENDFRRCWTPAVARQQQPLLARGGKPGDGYRSLSPDAGRGTPAAGGDRYLVADIEAIPLADAQFDLVWSHLAVQWCSSLPQALRALSRGATGREGGLYHAAGKFAAGAESGLASGG
jgi:malonyl-CoA O-methyltransferase